MLLWNVDPLFVFNFSPLGNLSAMILGLEWLTLFHAVFGHLPHFFFVSALYLFDFTSILVGEESSITVFD